MTKEAKVFYEYLGTGEEIRTIKNDEIHQSVAELLTHCTLHSFEAPDLFIKQDNCIVIIEHFAFDGSKIDRKGSKNQQEIARIQRMAEVTFSENENLYHLDTIECEYNYENYTKNALLGLQAHYKKIAKYKENLAKEGIVSRRTKIQVFFLVEDVSPLPLLYKNERGELLQVTLAYSRDFLNALESHPDLDGVIFCQRKNDGGKCTWIILRESISEYSKSTLDYNDSTIISFKPNTISFTIPNIEIM